MVAAAAGAATGIPEVGVLGATFSSEGYSSVSRGFRLRAGYEMAAVFCEGVEGTGTLDLCLLLPSAAADG